MHLSVLSLDEGEETGRLVATDQAQTAENLNLKGSGNSEDSFVFLWNGMLKQQQQQKLLPFPMPFSNLEMC